MAERDRSHVIGVWQNLKAPVQHGLWAILSVLPQLDPSMTHVQWDSNLQPNVDPRVDPDAFKHRQRSNPLRQSQNP